MSSGLHVFSPPHRLECPAGALLFCRVCRVAHRVGESDRATLYSNDGAMQATDDRQAFLRAHEDHSIGVLTRSSDAESRSHPRWDPMVRIAFEASDGESSWIVIGEREDLAGPRRYLVRPGRLVVAEESVSLDEDLLREMIDDALFPYAAPVSFLDGFLSRIRDLVEKSPIASFDLVGEDRRDPNVELAGLPDAVIASLCRLLPQVMPADEARRLTDLFERELRADLPVVRVRRRYVVAPG